MQKCNSGVGTTTVKGLIDRAAAQLQHLDSAYLDAEVLLATTLARSRAWIHTWPGHNVSVADIERYEALIGHRAQGVPLAYLTGVREFWSLSLQVTADTLVPRPDTELLVEVALTHIESGNRVMDLGTGSGAIALALASTRPDAQMLATDLSAPALDIARRNARRLHVDLTLVQCDWLDGFGDRCAQLIVSNPPYIATGDPHLRGDGVRHEPQLALTAGTDGLSAIRRIIPAAARCLSRAGWLILEHGCNQGQAVANLLETNGFFAISTIRDNAGLERITQAQCNMP